MPEYAIMRMKKIKSRGALLGAVRHDSREKPPKNADPERLALNMYVNTTQEAMDKYTRLKPLKIRKDAVHAVELILTATPSWFEKSTAEVRMEFVNASRKWCQDLFGEDNEIHSALHLDENSCHLHAIFMPLVNGKLNAKLLIGGPRHRMRELQDDFYEKVGKPLGMERGVENKNVHHSKTKDFGRLLKNVEEREEKVTRQTEDLRRQAEEINKNYALQVDKANEILKSQENFWKSSLENKDFLEGRTLGKILRSLDKEEMTECMDVMGNHADMLRARKFPTEIQKKKPKSQSDDFGY